MSVCLSVCLSVCPLAYPKNHMFVFDERAIRYVDDFTFYCYVGSTMGDLAVYDCMQACLVVVRDNNKLPVASLRQ